MQQHKNQREYSVACASCGVTFLTGANNKRHCSVECRIKDAASKFDGNDGCWNWDRSINPATGYGQLSAWEDGKRRLYTAHRVSFTAFIGAIPAGLSVCHTCDNRRCFNPEHLFVGTQQDNMDDCLNKGRFKPGARPAVHWCHKHPEKVKRGGSHPMYGKEHLRGADHPMSKLSESQAREIKASLEKGVVLAKRFGVTPTAISAIRLGRAWKNL